MNYHFVHKFSVQKEQKAQILFASYFVLCFKQTFMERLPYTWCYGGTGITK